MELKMGSSPFWCAFFPIRSTHVLFEWIEVSCFVICECATEEQKWKKSSNVTIGSLPKILILVHFLFHAICDNILSFHANVSFRFNFEFMQLDDVKYKSHCLFQFQYAQTVTTTSYNLICFLLHLPSM